MALEHPGRQGRVGAERRRPSEDECVAGERGARDPAQQSGTRDVDHEGPPLESCPRRASRPRPARRRAHRRGTARWSPCRRAAPPATTCRPSYDQPHPPDQRGGQRDRSEAGHQRGRGVPQREPPLTRACHLKELELHGRERRQGAAHTRAQEGALVGRGGQPLGQTRDEVPQEERTDDVDDEDRPGPRVGAAGERLRQARARHRADDPAAEDRGQLAAVVGGKHAGGVDGPSE